MRRMECMVTQTSEAVMKSVSNQVNDMNSTVKVLRKEIEVKFEKMDETFTAMEAITNRLENHEKKMNETTTNVADESLRMQDISKTGKQLYQGLTTTPQRKK